MKANAAEHITEIINFMTLIGFEECIWYLQIQELGSVITKL